jgi:hypothetical protein
LPVRKIMRSFVKIVVTIIHLSADLHDDDTEDSGYGDLAKG